jgi:serine protease
MSSHSVRRACLILVVTAIVTILQLPSAIASEDPFDAGVFARPGLSATDAASYTKAVRQVARVSHQSDRKGSLEADKWGRTNELILLPDGSDSALVAMLPGFVPAKLGMEQVEDAIVNQLSQANAAALASFGNPIDARYLIDDDRPSDAQRAKIEAKSSENELLRFVVLRYGDVEHALAALEYLTPILGEEGVGMNYMTTFDFAPNDPYFAIYNATDPSKYQWGLHAMAFDAAWDTTKGSGYVADLDGGFPGDVPPADLQGNTRLQFSKTVASSTCCEAHGTHTAGIIAATGNNGIGVSGGCLLCSLGMFRMDGTIGTGAAAIPYAIDRGFQVFNMSWSNSQFTNLCPASTIVSYHAVCVSLDAAALRDLLPVASAGNNGWATTGFPARDSRVLAAGGAQIASAPSNPYTFPYSWQLWSFSSTLGSTYPGTNGVIAPAGGIVSTFPVGVDYDTVPPYCSDLAGHDTSGPGSDGYGTCTGTSMSAPFVSALAGIVRSINPRLTASQVKTTIQQNSGSFTGHYPNNGSPMDLTSKGMPNASAVVASAVSQTTNRLTPLFVLYSSSRLDYFYTIVPQMASAAIAGTMEPRNSGSGCTMNYTSNSTWISGYLSFPGTSGSCTNPIPGAQVWVFTTPLNPKSATDPLVPLYRMSWRCGDPSSNPPSICSTNPLHIDVTYTADAAGIVAFQNVGYKLDGIEGYIYPKTSPQPTATVKLMRKYNPTVDDHAIFPDTLLTQMASQGYTQNSGSDYIGYVYVNNGTVPTIQ